MASIRLSTIERWPSFASMWAMAPGMRSASQRLWLAGQRLSSVPCHGRMGTAMAAMSNPPGATKAR